MPLAWISLTFSRHFSLSLIASSWCSGLHPVSSHSCCMYVRAGPPAFARSYVGVHRSTSLMSSSLLLQQCPAHLVRLTCIVFVMGGRWPYSWCFGGVAARTCFQKFHSCLFCFFNTNFMMSYKISNRSVMWIRKYSAVSKEKYSSRFLIKFNSF